MSTIISIKNDNSRQVTDRTQPAPEDADWSEIGRALGYPESWVSILRQRLSSQGKSWKWINSTSVLEPAGDDSPSLREGGRALLIINNQTPLKLMREALLLAENSNAELIVICTSKPPLIGGTLSSSEVDQKFNFELEKGRALLERVAGEAKRLGVRSETSFIWAESSQDLLKQHDFQADLVIDKTA